MILKKTFMQFLQGFDSNLRYEDLPHTEDVAVLYHKKKRLGSFPKDLIKARYWHDAVSDKRDNEGYTTEDGGQHRSLSGIGLLLLNGKIISPKQFVDNFTTHNNRELINRIKASNAGLM